MHVHPGLVRVLVLSDRFIVMPDHRFHQLSGNLFNSNLRNHWAAKSGFALFLHLPGLPVGFLQLRTSSNGRGDVDPAILSS
jgi:hypothetical protein